MLSIVANYNCVCVPHTLCIASYIYMALVSVYERQLNSDIGV